MRDKANGPDKLNCLPNGLPICIPTFYDVTDTAKTILGCFLVAEGERGREVAGMVSPDRA